MSNIWKQNDVENSLINLFHKRIAHNNSIPRYQFKVSGSKFEVSRLNKFHERNAPLVIRKSRYIVWNCVLVIELRQQEITTRWSTCSHTVYWLVGNVPTRH